MNPETLLADIDMRSVTTTSDKKNTAVIKNENPA